MHAVHPHVHGEHPLLLRIAAPGAGSSPRTWGTPGGCGYRDVEGRFIPTYMGNTHRLVAVPNALAVHPHVHGEHQPSLLDSVTSFGSSPRTWGTHECVDGDKGFRRFIPTYMGNTSSPPPINRLAAVHPHVHGEHRLRLSITRFCAGSSPRTWGTRAARHR